MTGSAQEMLDALDALIRRSEYIAAFDLAQQGVAAHPDSVALRHRGVLSLARMGATARAAALFDSWGLHEVSDDEDVLALWARLKKDEAQALSGPAQVAALEDAAAAYARGFEAGDGGYYPAINVASLSLLAGQVDKAREWAARAQALAMGEDYWSLSTRAEAALVLNRPEDAASWIARAAAAAPDDHAARATSRAQMAQIIAHLDLDPSLLKPLTAPRVAHFCGHMVTGLGGRMPASEVARITEAVRTTIADDDIGFAVGSLAGGADIIVAEEILAAGAELSVVLPFDQAEFVDVSVRPSGSDWVARFDACLAAAHSVHFVTEEAYLGDSGLFAYASHFALGLARLRAQMLGAELIQLAVWDGAAPDPEAAAGTAHDLATGYRMGLAQRLVPSREGAVLDPRRFAGHVPPDMGNRRQRTMIFGDLKGFSALSDAQLPRFVDTVLGTCAEVLDAHGAHLQFRNTWGDGLFVVFDDLAAAVACAFTLRDAIGGIDLAAHGLPPALGLRLGLHYGPVYESTDPVLQRLNFFGYHVSRAARIEPITPEGEVYVTEQAAAALAVDAYADFRCDYVGRVPLAKGYGTFPMYALSRR